MATSCRCDRLAVPLFHSLGLSRWWPKQLVFSLSSGTASSFSSLSLSSASGWRGFLVNPSLASLFCAAHQSEPTTSLRAFPDRTELMTDRLVSNPPTPLERTSRTPLHFFIRLTCIFQPVFHLSLRPCRLFVPFKHSDSPRSCDWEARAGRPPPQRLF